MIIEQIAAPQTIIETKVLTLNKPDWALGFVFTDSYGRGGGVGRGLGVGANLGVGEGLGVEVGVAVGVAVAVGVTVAVSVGVGYCWGGVASQSALP